MPLNKEQNDKSWKPSTHVFLVLFVFIILFTSIVLTLALMALLAYLHVLPSFEQGSITFLILFMLVVSLSLGTILAAIFGVVFLQPLRRFIHATNEVAMGNFNVRVLVKAPYELKCLSESFNEMTKALGSIETLRDDFVGNISHEFKTPVTSIRGFAKILKKDTISEEQRNEYLDIIIKESARLAQLSSNVLLLSNLHSTDKITDMERYCLDEQLRQVVLLLERSMTSKKIEYEVNLEAVQVAANKELMQQVWINLLYNAIKFTPEHGRIQINLYKDRNRILVEVADNGIGMDEEVQKHLFDKFYQGDKSHAAEGNGLGLSLVHRIVKLNNGNIYFHSLPNHGSTFVIELPS